MVRSARVLLAKLAILGGQQDLDVAEHALDHGGVAAHGDALPAVVEVVVVIGQAHRKALDDARRQLGAAATPLLLGIALDELLEHVAADQRQRLLLEVLRLALADEVCGLGLLALDDLDSLGRGADAPHLRERVHVERQVIQLVLVDGHGAVHIVVELGESVDVIPHRAQGGVEDVRAVAVHVDALHVLGVNVAGDMVAAIDDQAGLAELGSLMAENRRRDAGTDNQIIIMGQLHTFPL